MPFILMCMNVEKDHDNFVNLLAETKSFGNLVRNFEGSFDEHIDIFCHSLVAIPLFFSLTTLELKVQTGILSRRLCQKRLYRYLDKV